MSAIPRWMLLWRGQPYRFLMKLAHRFHWHYAPPLYPDGDKLLWCQWCGFRAIVERRGDVKLKKPGGAASGTGETE